MDNKISKQSHNKGFIIDIGQSCQLVVDSQEDHLNIIVINTLTLQTYHRSVHQYPNNQPNNHQPTPQNVYNTIQKYRTEPHRLKLNNNSLQVIENGFKVNTSIIDLQVVKNDSELINILMIKSIVGRNREDDRVIGDQVRQMEGLMDSRHAQIGSKLKGIGQLVQNLSNKIQQTKEQTQTKYEELQYTMAALKLQQKNKIDEMIKRCESLQAKLDNELQIVKKDLSRSLANIKEVIGIDIELLKKEDVSIWKKLDFYKLDKMKKDVQNITQAFQYEIKVKDYIFIPNPKCLANKQLYYLNEKSLKNLQEMKDYNKIMGQAPFPKGLHKFTIKIKNIKNNGLLMGICKAYQISELDKAAFNDKNMIVINSCGYVINKGLMTYHGFKLNNGDLVKICVNTSLGEVKWWSNGVEIAAAELGYFKNEDVYPVIGLGYVLDQIELMNITTQKAQFSDYDSYKDQLVRLNKTINPKKHY